jgi:hypothetical protein
LPPVAQCAGERRALTTRQKQGPEIRTKNLRPNATVDGKRSWFLERGDKFVFHTDETIEGDNTHVAVTYANFSKVLKGERAGPFSLCVTHRLLKWATLCWWTTD